MPIPTDSEEWKSAETPPRIQNEVLEFLRNNPDRAFRAREIADEIIDTDWESIEETERLQQQLDEEEYERRLYEGELPDEEVSTLGHLISMNTIDIALMQLINMDLVETRMVSVEAFNLPDDFEEVAAYAYAGVDD